MANEKKLNKATLKKLADSIAADSQSALGSYLYNEFKIIVRRPMSGAERYSKLYNERRTQGLCVACGKKITKTNPSTGRKYRLCDDHRNKIDGVQQKAAKKSVKKTTRRK